MEQSDFTFYRNSATHLNGADNSSNGHPDGHPDPLLLADSGLSAASRQDRRRERAAAALFGVGEPCGAEANIAKLLASEASWAAAQQE